MVPTKTYAYQSDRKPQSFRSLLSPLRMHVTVLPPTVRTSMICASAAPTQQRTTASIASARNRIFVTLLFVNLHLQGGQLLINALTGQVLLEEPGCFRGGRLGARED